MSARCFRRLVLEGALAVAPGALLLGSAEFAARLWVRRHGDPLDRAGSVLRMDAALGWRQREGFDGRFLGLPLRTDALGLRQPGGETGRGAGVLFLGPSSTFGWGVREDQTYARRLEGLLEERGRPLPVVNAGEIGFSTWQGLGLYRRELRGLAPRVLVVCYGANDVDRYRFFFNDRRPDSLTLARPRSPASVAAANVFLRSQGLRLLARAAGRLRGRGSCLPDGGDPRRDPAVPSLRVPLADFTANLEALVDEGRRAGAQVLLMTTPYRLAAPAAADRRRAEDGYERSAAEAREGRCERARADFERARLAEPGRIARDLSVYNAAERRLAARLGVGVIDAAALLKQDPAAFVDPIHPSAEGHRRIAEALAAALAARRREIITISR